MGLDVGRLPLRAREMLLGSAFLCWGPNEPFLQSLTLSYLGKGQETPASEGLLTLLLSFAATLAGSR